MNKPTNIAVTLTVYIVAWTAAGLLLRGDMAALASELSRAMWTVAVLIVTTLGQLAWKAHEAQEAKGLDMDQLLRVRRIAKLIGLRAYLLSGIALATAIVGIAASTPTLSTMAPRLAAWSVGTMVATIGIWLVWLPLLYSDLQRFQGLAHEQQVRREAAADLAARLRGALKGTG